MERPIWQGHISFGLVSIPVSLFSGAKKNDLHFKLVDSRDNAHIHYSRINEETGKTVPWSYIAKAYELNKDEFVVLTEEDFKHAESENIKTIEIETFIDQEELAPIYFEKPYYLVPGKSGEKGYVLLREILEETKKIGIAKITIRTRPHIAALMIYQDMLILNLLRFPQELRKKNEFNLPTKDLKHYKITSKEIEIAKQLVDSMTTKWQPSQYHDDYHEILLKWINERAKTKGKKASKHKVSKKQTKTKVIDFISLLKKSIKDKKAKSTSAKKSSKKHSAR